jgi:hypothetical protein
LPSGLPPPSAVTNRTLSAFALDTSIIEAASFRFDKGALRLLTSQLPTWLQLVMPSIVEQEVFDHRSAHVNRAEQQIKAGYADLRRHGGPGFLNAEPVVAEDAIEVAGVFFDQQIERFIESFNGARLDLSMDGLAQKLFDAYFNLHPPFGAGKDKKHEFPDAAILFTLEDFASQRGIQLIAVSKDDGWKAFAARSPHIFCVSSLDDLTSLFEHTTSEALSVRRKIVAELDRENSQLRRKIKSSLRTGISAIQWSIRPWRIYNHQVHVQVADAEFANVEPRSDGVGLWLTSPKVDRCVAEIVVDALVNVTIEGTISRAPDGEEVASGQSVLAQVAELKVFLECSGRLLHDHVDAWSVNVDLANPIVTVNVGKAPFDPPLSGKVPRPFSSGYPEYDLDEDDLPF